MKPLWRTIVATVLVGGLLGAPVAAGAGEEAPDGMVEPSAYDWVIDSQGELWVKVTFESKWGSKPPLEEDFRSFFFSLEIVVDEILVETGWELHEGTQTILGSPSHLFILDNGCLLIGTGVKPSSPSQVSSVSARFGSWYPDADNPIFGFSSEAVDSGSIATGDPFAVLGGQVVFDLLSGEMIMTTTTTTTTTTEASSPTDSGTTQAPVTTQQVVPGGRDDPAIIIGDGGLSPLVAILFLFGLFFLLLLFLWFRGLWTPFWLTSGYGKRVDDDLDEDEDEDDGGDDSDTRTRDDATTTGSHRDEGDPEDEPDVTEDREPAQPDCAPLRAECERLKVVAAEAQLAAGEARASAEQAAAECARATQRLADLDARVEDLDSRDDAPQRYQRLAEAQQAARDARAGLAGICDAVEPARAAADAAEAKVSEANTAADAACRKAEECESQL